MALLSLLAVASLPSGVVWKVLLALPNGTHVPHSLPPPSLLPPLCEDCVPLWGPGAGSAHCDEVRCERCPAPPCDHPALPRCQGPALLLWSRRPSENRLQEGAGLWRRLWSVAQQQSWHVLRAMSRPPPQLPPGGPPQRGRSRFGQLLAETKESVIRELRSLQRWIRGGRRDGYPSENEL